MLKGVVTSDLHLMSLQNIFPNALEMQLSVFRSILQWAVNENIEHVFVAGDLCHSPFMTDEVLLNLINLFMEFDSKLNMYYICGNHDFSDVKKTSMDVLAAMVDHGFFTNLRIFRQSAVKKIDGVPVQFLPFPAISALSKPRPSLNFAHVGVTGAINDNGTRLSTNSSFVNRRGDFTFSGHLHTAQVANGVVFCGDPYQTKFGENSDKGFIVFSATFEKDLTVKYKRVLVDQPFSLKTLYIEKPSDLDKLKVSDTIKYSLHVKEGVMIPSTLSADFPNIVSISGKHEKELDEHSFTLTNTPTISPTFGLKKYLYNYGLTNDQIDVGMSMVKAKLAEYSEV